MGSAWLELDLKPQAGNSTHTRVGHTANLVQRTGIDADEYSVITEEVAGTNPGALLDQAAGFDLRRLVHRSMLMVLADDILLVVDQYGTVLDANQAALDVHGGAIGAIIGTNSVDYVHPDSHADYFAFASLIGATDGAMRRRLKCLRGDGSILYLDVKASWSAATERFYLVERDVSADVARTTELRQLSERPAEQALTDALTGVHNRSAFDDRMEVHTFARDECLVVIDVDWFKNVNDAWGHIGGDELLRSVAGRLRCNLRQGDFVARVGGDEFVAILEGASDHDKTFARLSALRRALSTPHKIDGRDLVVTCSIGATASRRDECGDTWHRRADAALYQSKADGRNTLTLV